MNKIGNVVEMIRLAVDAANVDTFLAKRKLVDSEVSQLAGYRSTSVLQISDENWIIFIEWEDMASVQAAQKVTETLPSITNWISTAKSFVSFETAAVRYTH